MSDEMTEQTSEYGDGFAYCLGLFLAHAGRIRSGFDASLWFNGAADHLFGLVAPSCFTIAQRVELEEFRDKCLAFRLCMDGESCTRDDVSAALQRAKDFLLAWDIQNGIPAIKGDWE